MSQLWTKRVKKEMNTTVMDDCLSAKCRKHGHVREAAAQKVDTSRFSVSIHLIFVDHPRAGAGARHILQMEISHISPEISSTSNRWYWTQTDPGCRFLPGHLDASLQLRLLKQWEMSEPSHFHNMVHMLMRRFQPPQPGMMRVSVYR